MRSFGSDNHSGIHPSVLRSIEDANQDHAIAYGSDAVTERALKIFEAEFGSNSESYFVFNGTGANVLALQGSLQSFQAVICSDSAHIVVDECGAVEKHTQSKLLTVPSKDGKLNSRMIEHFLSVIGNQHHVQPRVISITQPTELGALYSLKELSELSKWAHSHGMILHMDGARIANAAAALKCTLKDLTANTGVDILSFGGTKNGLMNAEAVVILNPELQRGFQYIRKQGMHLASKMRFISAQFIAYFKDDLWRKNAEHSNAMASKLATGIENISGLKLARPTQVNSVFAVWPRELIDKMQKKHYFYVWNEAANEVRLVCSFDTTDSDVDAFLRDLSL